MPAIASWRACVILVLSLVAAPQVASAHGRLKSSSPGAGAHLGTSPRELRLEFSEVPDLTFSKVILLAPGGRAIALGALAYAPDSRRTVVAAIPGQLQSGTYVVQWQLAGDDGHPMRGTFDFVIAPGAMGTVGDTAAHGATAAMMPMADSGADSMAMHHDPASMPEGSGFGAESPAYVAVRWVQFIALLLTIGAISFRQFVLGFLRRKEDPDSPMLDVAEARAARVGHVAVGTLFVTLLLRLFAQSYAMHGAADAWNARLSAQMIMNTVWGRGWVLQLIGVLLGGVGFHLADRARNARRAQPIAVGRASSGWPLATLGGVFLAFSQPFSGHASSAPKLQALAVLADGLHVLGASSWLGSLTLVMLAGIPAALRLTESERGPMVAELINAFSPVALASAGLATATGVFAAWLHVGTIPNLWGTRYGITLLVKLTVLGVVALTGFYNWRVVKPRLGTDAATQHLVRSARVEVTVAVVVLLITAILVASPTSMDATM
jgi:putative copper export protein/methionine-rich copper-binding protein CopC